MKKGLIWIVGFLTTIFIFISLCHANPWIIDIDSRTHNLNNPVKLFFAAGTYAIQGIMPVDDPLYEAWNSWGNTSSCKDPAGCPRTNPTGYKGWLNQYTVLSDKITAVSINGVSYPPVSTEPNPQTGNFFLVNQNVTKFRVDDRTVYSDPTSALVNSQIAVFTLQEPDDVGFAIRDKYLSDNHGGLSLRISAPVEKHLDVPVYIQRVFGEGCSNDCSPVAGAMILGYWDSHGWPRMVPRGSADFGKNPDGVNALYNDLVDTMNYVCIKGDSGTDPDKVAPGLIETASNMDPGAEFYEEEEITVRTENKNHAFDIIKNHINNGIPLIINVNAAHFRFRSLRDGNLKVLDVNGDAAFHSMVITGYYHFNEVKKIYLNVGLDHPTDVGVANYNDLGLDLGSGPRQLWLNCVVPGGRPTPLAFPWVDLLLFVDEHK